MNEKVVIPVDQIESIILPIRGQKVILSRDLAQLYGVTTGNLNKAVNVILIVFRMILCFN